MEHETEGVVMAQSETRVCSNARSKTVSRDIAWAVLLAGGDGIRLQSLTQKIAGDCRPKQFCQIYGGKSLLTQTRERIAPLFNCRRTLCVDFSREVLAALPHRLVVVKDGASGWADLGTPARVIDTLVRNGIQATWFGSTTGRKAAAPQRASVDRSGDAIECS